MASELHKGIVELKNDVSEMARLAESMLEDSVNALMKVDVDLANKVIDRKHDLRKLDDKIEETALRLIALYQPMAIDLRRIAAALKMITYLNRIGRYGKDIALIVVRNISTESVNIKLINMTHIWEHVKSMISDAIEAYDKEDVALISDFANRDDEVDELRWSIFRECVTYMMENPKNITICAHLQMIARYLERCGDHACKMAEKIHYMVKGEHIEIS
jgi:phosphate transport system protein